MNFLGESFHYQDDALQCGGVSLVEIAQRTGTPCYVYSAADIIARLATYREGLSALPHRIAYSVKANSNLAVLALMARNGAGFDIVSGGELHRVIKAGGDPSTVVFSGVGKTPSEVEQALECGIHSFNCESEAEIALVDAKAARLGKCASVAVRVNPDVDAATHPYISTGLREHKFGVDIAEAERVYSCALSLRHVVAEGVSCHIGSQILTAAPLFDALERVLELVERLRKLGAPISNLDLGGGIGVPYHPGQESPDLALYARTIAERLSGRGLTLMLEPGRSIVAQAGVLLSRVLYRKQTAAKEFIVVDAAMNDLLRPSLYQAHHEIIPVRRNSRPMIEADVVGPVCESGDFLARDREMVNAFPGDLLAICTAGAYGFVASSNYNSRPRAAEVMVEDGRWRIVRQRETYDDLIRGECV